MTPHEAISQLEEINREPHCYSEAVEMAIEALEKQIPKKTKQFEMGLDGKIIIPCGNCESTLDGDWDYCPFCGQNILWRVKGDH